MKRLAFAALLAAPSLHAQDVLLVPSGGWDAGTCSTASFRDDTLCYTASGSFVELLDARDASLLGRWPQRSRIQRLVCDGGLLAAFTDDGVTALLDVDDPASLPERSAIPDGAEYPNSARKDLADGLFVQMREDTLDVWGLDDPSSPQLLSSTVLGPDAHFVSLDDSLLAVVRAPGEIDVFDLRVPSSPQLASTIEDVAEYGVPELSGRTLLAMTDSLRLFSLENVAQPERLAAVQGGMIYGWATDGEHAIVSDADSVRVHDLSIPGQPQFVAAAAALRAHGLALRGNRVVVGADTRVHCLQGQPPTGLVQTGLHFVGGMAEGLYRGGSVLWASLGLGGLASFDLDPSGPLVEAVPRRQTTGAWGSVGWQQHLVLATYPEGLRLFNTSDPLIPQLLDEDPEGDDRVICGENGQVWMIQDGILGQDTLRGWSIAGDVLQRLGTCATTVGGSTSSLAVSEGKLMQLTFNGCELFDLTDPGAPQSLGVWIPPMG